MSAALIAFLGIQLVAAVLLIVLAVLGFRTHVGYGFGPLLILLGPFAVAMAHLPAAVGGGLMFYGFVALVVFALKHQKRAGILSLLFLACRVASAALLFTSPAVIAFYTHYNPAFGRLVQTVNPSAYAQAQQLPSVGFPGFEENKPKPVPTPREVRDLAEYEAPDPTPFVDRNAAPRAAYLKHAKELNTLYEQLDAERPKLKPGSPAVAVFNAKAARYQQGLTALTDEKAKLDTLDHASSANAEAAAALGNLPALVQKGDYETFAATLKRALSDYRQTPSFSAIVAYARAALPQATPDKVLAGLQSRAAGSAREEFDKTTKKVQAIVNQVPPIVVPPPGSTEVYKYSYHPGAENPDYTNNNLIATREIWKGDYAYLEDAPNVFYRSADCEFNPKTKYFYLSRSLPKKKLTDAEYQQLTQLYHQLGQQEKAIAEVAPPAKDAERISGDLAALKLQFDALAAK